MLRAVRSVLLGPLNAQCASVADAPHLWRKLPYAVLVTALLVFGFAPRLLTDKIVVPVQQQTLKPYGTSPGAPETATAVAQTR